MIRLLSTFTIAFALAATVTIGFGTGTASAQSVVGATIRFHSGNHGTLLPNGRLKIVDRQTGKAYYFRWYMKGGLVCMDTNRATGLCRSASHWLKTRVR